MSVSHPESSSDETAGQLAAPLTASEGERREFERRLRNFGLGEQHTLLTRREGVVESGPRER